MSYLVLARKFRPQTFQSIAGQEHISRALANAILRGRVPHALLFTGPRGVGKTTSARVFARALNCTGRTLPSAEELRADPEAWRKAEPCGTCGNCQEIAKSSSIAVWEIDGASNNSVDNVRELIDSLRSLPPPGSEYKIYIIDEVHMLSVPAFNALLKSLEEPPPQTVFIFATTEPHKIPETVISRCQRHDFRRLNQDTIAEQLASIAAKEQVTVEPEVLSFIARRAQGGMRDAQSMMDRLIASAPEGITLAHARAVFGVLDEGFFFEQSDLVFKQDPQGCFVQLDEAFRQSIDVRAFVADFLAHWRKIMLVAVALESASQKNNGRINDAALERMLELRSEDLERYVAQVRASNSFDALRLFELAERTADQALRSNHPRFVLEAGLAKMATLTSLRPLPEILSKLEAAAAGGFAGAAFTTDTARAGAASNPSTAMPGRAVSSDPAAGHGRAASPAQPAHFRAASAPKKQPEQPAAVDSGTAGEFNPSWQSFLAHVKSCKAIRLETFLKRVSPKQFSSGTLVLEGERFVLESLQDPDTFPMLRQCLASYSGLERWEVRCIEYQPGQTESSEQPQRQSNAPAQRNGFVPGSAVALEAEAERERRRQIEKEARQSGSVQQILSVFEGSRVERVEPLES